MENATQFRRANVSEKLTSKRQFMLLGLLVLIVFLSLMQVAPPAAVPANAPPAHFSSGRAMAHLHEIAQAPHPTGSAENARVRAYLVVQLRALGLQPEVQQTTSVNHQAFLSTAAIVHNVMARIKGTQTTGALLLVAHYDSVSTSPGANDDGAGVVAILETVRAILSGPPLQNDVIVLFTDGEELGLLGAQAFAEQHPWMAEVALVLNLEARGAGGPVTLFETSVANRALIAEYASAVPHPVTTSLLPSLYRSLPNDTDMTVFLDHNVPGLNFAYADEWTRYHTGRDSLDNVDERSIQHHGDNLLALVQRFGNQALDSDMLRSASEDAVFFSLLSRWVIHYPASWTLPLVIIATHSFVGIVLYGRARKRLTLAGVALGAAMTLICAGILGAAGYGGVQMLNALKSNELSVFLGGTYNIHWYELGFLLFFGGAGSWFVAAVMRRLPPLHLATGALLVWLMLAVACSALLPGGSYLFIWPLIAGLLALTLQILVADTWFARWAGMLPLVVGAGLLTPALYLVLLMVGINGTPLLAVMVALFVAMVLPTVKYRSECQVHRWWLFAGQIAAGVSLLLVVALTTTPNSVRPRQNLLFYSLDVDRQQAAWVAFGQTREPWTASFVGHHPDHAHLGTHFPLLSFIELEAASHTAPTFPMLAPTVAVLGDHVDSTKRTLQLHIASQRGATEYALLITAPQGIVGTSIYGEAISYALPLPELMINGGALPAEGFELTLTLGSDQAVTLQVADIIPALPEFPPTGPRPDNVTAMAGGFTPDTSSVVHRTVTIAAP